MMHSRWRSLPADSLLPKLLYLFIATAPCLGLEFQQNITVLDQQPAGSVIGQIGAGIPNANPPFSVYLTNENDRNDLDILSNGTIRLKTKIDRSRKSLYEFLAISGGTIQIRVSIWVIPLTNQPPVFNPSSINLAILESLPIESAFFLGSASDPDFGPSGIARYEISSGNTNNAFRLNVTQAPNGAKIVSLVLTKKLDYKAAARYLITVRAYDTGSPALFADLLVNVTVVNVYDNQPVFSKTSFNAVVREDVPIGTAVVRAVATHQGSSASGLIAYSIDQQQSNRGQGDFTIDVVTGVISVAQRLSFTRQSSYDLTVVAKDDTVATLQATAEVQIQLVSVNIQPPVITLIFFSDDGSATVTKSASPENDSIAYMSVTYPDQTDTSGINVTLLGGDGYFGLRRVANIVFLVVVSRSLEKAKAFYQMSVYAVDTIVPSRFAYKNFKLYIVDGNSSAVTFSQNPYSSSVDSTSLPGTSVLMVSLMDGNIGNETASCFYRILPLKDSGYERFYIDRYSGVIVTAVTFDCKSPSGYRLTVAALDRTSSSVLAVTDVVVTVRFVFNSPPFFEQTFYRILIPGSLSVSSCIGRVSVGDYPGCSSLTTDRIQYALSTDLQRSLPQFGLNPDSGKICLKGELDTASTPSYDLTITASNDAGFRSSCLVQLSLIPTNRLRPTFTVSKYRTVIPENLLPGSNVVLVKASSTSSRRLSYQIFNGNFGTVFNISSDSGGYIQLRRTLPAYPTGYNLTVIAVDEGGLMSDIYASVIIDVIKSSQTFLMFTKPVYEMRIPEDVPRGQLVGRVEMQNNAKVRYAALVSESSTWFQLDASTGQILTIGQLDREYLSSVLLNIQALSTDGLNTTSFAQVLITITDVNDNSPVFATSQLSLEIPENIDAGSLLYVAQATDKDIGDNALVYYSITGDSSSTFVIDRRLGEIRLQRPVRFPSKFSLTVIASDGGSPSRSATLNVTVATVGVNNNSPVFSSQGYHFTISNPVAPFIGAVSAVDADFGNNANVSYYLSDVRLSDLFLVEPISGKLYSRVIMDKPQQNQFIFQVVAVDNGFPVRSSSVDVTVTIEVESDDTPLVTPTSYDFSVLENQPPLTTVGFLDVKTVSSPNSLTFTLQSPNEYFDVIPSSGEILTKKILDREDVSVHRFSIVVVYRGSTPRTIGVTVTVLDVNDNSPHFDEHAGSAVYVAKNQPTGTKVVQMIANDPDNGSNGTVSYYFPQENSHYYGQHFEIDSLTGWISSKEQFDEQSKPEFVLKVVAEDGAHPPRTTSLILQVFVGDGQQNELQLPPAYSFAFTIQENAAVGSNITSLALETGSFGEYFIMKGNAFDSFGMDATTGNLYAALPLEFDDWSLYSLLVVIVESDPMNPVCVVALVNVTVIKTVSRSPQFEFDPQSLRLRENIPKEAAIFRFDAGNFDNKEMIYSIVSQHPPGIDWFQVDRQTGFMTVNSEIDYEQVRQITIVVMAMVLMDEVTQQPTTMTMVIDVTDVNDNKPEFGEALSRGVQVLEDVSEGAVILGVCAIDADSSDAGRVTYKILGGNEMGHFYLDPDSGLLSVVRTLNRQRSTNAFQLNVSAADHGRPSLTSTSLVTITVIDVNKNTPLFDEPWYNATVFENASPGAVIVSVTAADRITDSTVEDVNLTYSIPFGLSNKFRVNPLNGDLVTNVSFDRELTATYSFAVSVRTNGFPALFNTVAVQVKVLDTNDNVPVFSVPTIVLDVPENEGPVVLHVFRASDDDAGLNGLISYFITGGNTDSRFFLDKTTGALVCTPLDREAVAVYNLTVMAVDSGTPSLNSTINAIVRVLDDNDNDPVFLQTTYAGSISEKVPVGTIVLSMQAMDLDDDVNGNVSYGLSNDVLGMFRVDPGTGALVTARELDTERIAMYSFEVTATDGCPYRPRSRSVRVNVTVTTTGTARNDSTSPSLRFCSDRYVAYVWENNARSTYVTQVRAVVSARNGTSSDSTTYWIATGNVQNAFVMDPPNAGIIKTNGILDREIRDTYRMDIQASTPDRQQMPDGAVVSVRVQVIDVNDNAPFFPVNRAVSVREGVKPGTSVLQVTANDVDLYPTLVYELSSVGGVGCATGGATTQSAFTIDRYSGRIWTDQRLDYESCTTYQLTVQVSDQLHNASTPIQINVIDDNDNEPIFSQSIYQTSVPEATPAGLSIAYVTATDRDSGDNGRVTYSLLSPTIDYIRINSTTGKIYTNRPVIYDPNQTTLYFVVVATDHGTPPLSSVATVVLKIIEVNKRPAFNATTYSLSISGRAVPGSMLMQLSATDLDLDYDNHRLEYSIFGGNGSIFGIGQDSGEIFLLSHLDAVDTVHYLLRVMVQDRGVPSLNSSTTILITIQVNDEKPELTNNLIVLSVQENASIGFVLTTLRSNSLAQTRLLFNFSSGNEDETFSLNTVTGVLSLKSTLNFERKRFYRLVINVVDINASTPRILSFSTIDINVTEVNKYRPRYPVAYYSAAVTENLRSGAYVFTAQAFDKDVGPYGVLRYRLVGNSAAANGMFSIDELSGEVCTTQRLTFSSSASNNYSYLMIAEDAGGWSASAALMVYVKPEPVQPRFGKPSYGFQAHGNAKVGDIIGTVEAFDSNGQSIRNVIYFLRPENVYFAINSTVGAIYVKRDLNSLNVSRRRRSPSRHKRSLENVTLHVFAQSGFLQRKEDGVDVVVTVNQSCDGCAVSSPHQSPGLQGTPLILVIVFIVFGVLLAIVVMISVIIYRRKAKPKPTNMLPLDPITQPKPPTVTLSRNASPDLVGNESTSPEKPGLHMRPTSEQSRSVSSGRGSVEKNEDVDEEISMINAMPSTIPSTRIPDSGIQQDDDTVSEFSVHNHREYLARLGIDPSKITRAVPSGGEMTDTPRLDVGDVIYTQLDGSERNSVVDEGAIARSYGCRDMRPSDPNALTSIVNTEEVFSGSYNWDYLINWGPQFLPMADLFTEIARLKDDGVIPKKKPTQIVPQVPGINRQPRTIPPPLITDTPPRVAPITHPLNGSTQSSQMRHSRTPSNRSLAASSHSRVPSAHGHSSRVRLPAYLPRTSAATTTTPSRGGPIPLKSPISYDSNFTSPITPPFKQNVSPLGTQSPSVISFTNSASVCSPNCRPNPRQQTQRTVARISPSNSDQEIHI